MMNPDDMDSNVIGIASFLFIIADLDVTVRDVTGNGARSGHVNLKINWVRREGMIYGFNL